MTEQSPYEAVNLYFQEAAALIDLDDEMCAVLTTPYREVSVQVAYLICERADLQNVCIRAELDAAARASFESNKRPNRFTDR